MLLYLLVCKLLCTDIVQNYSYCHDHIKGLGLPLNWDFVGIANAKTNPTLYQKKSMITEPFSHAFSGLALSSPLAKKNLQRFFFLLLPEFLIPLRTYYYFKLNGNLIRKE